MKVLIDIRQNILQWGIYYGKFTNQNSNFSKYSGIWLIYWLQIFTLKYTRKTTNYIVIAIITAMYCNTSLAIKTNYSVHVLLAYTAV